MPSIELLRVGLGVAGTRALSTVGTANKKLKKDVNEITDEELEDILRAARNEKS
jgi:hypothetical protein